MRDLQTACVAGREGRTLPWYGSFVVHLTLRLTAEELLWRFALRTGTQPGSLA